jgi:hypothetical protein
LRWYNITLVRRVNARGRTKRRSGSSSLLFLPVHFEK